MLNPAGNWTANAWVLEASMDAERRHTAAIDASRSTGTVLSRGSITRARKTTEGASTHHLIGRCKRFTR
jgi:hypothetical protein